MFNRTICLASGCWVLVVSAIVWFTVAIGQMNLFLLLHINTKLHGYHVHKCTHRHADSAPGKIKHTVPFIFDGKAANEDSNVDFSFQNRCWISCISWLLRITSARCHVKLKDGNSFELLKYSDSLTSLELGTSIINRCIRLQLVEGRNMFGMIMKP